MNKYIAVIITIAAIVLSFSLYVGHLHSKNADLVETVRQMRLDSLNAAAALDSTTRVLADTRADRVTWRRRAMQSDLHANSLERELALRPTTSTRTTVRVDTVTVVDTADAVAASDTLQTYELGAYQQPFMISASVIVWPQRARARGIFDVGLDPIPLSVRTTCGPRDDLGVAEAQVFIEGPRWAKPEITEATFTPGVCSRTPAPTRAWYNTWDTGAAAASAGFLLLDDKPTEALIVGGLWGAYKLGSWVVSR